MSAKAYGPRGAQGTGKISGLEDAVCFRSMQRGKDPGEVATAGVGEAGVAGHAA